MEQLNREHLTDAEKTLLERERLGYYSHESMPNNSNSYNYSPLYDNGGYCSKFN